MIDENKYLIKECIKWFPSKKNSAPRWEIDSIFPGGAKSPQFAEFSPEYRQKK